MRVLVAGWWSFLHGEATAGDLAAGAAVVAWLSGAGIDHRVAWSPVLAGSELVTPATAVTLEDCDPGGFTDLVFVCGPVAGWQVEQLCDRFAGCRRTAVGVSDVAGGAGHRFDRVIPRDGHGPPSADLSLCEPAAPRWPLAVLVRANPQPEYGGRSRHDEVHAVVEAALADLPFAVVDADTRVDPRNWRQRRGAQLDALLAAADVVVTTRLHGLVLSLRAGTPAVAVDPVDGGAKVTAQARALAWPAVIPAAEVDAGTLARHLDWCAGAGATGAVARSLEAAQRLGRATRAELLAGLGD